MPRRRVKCNPSPRNVPILIRFVLPDGTQGMWIRRYDDAHVSSGFANIDAKYVLGYVHPGAKITDIRRATKQEVADIFDEDASNPPKSQDVVGYLSEARVGEELTSFDGKRLGWKYSYTTDERRTSPQGDKVYAVVLRKGRQVAGGYWLGDAGTLFRGEVARDEHEGEVVARNNMDYWAEKDSEDEELGEDNEEGEEEE